MSTILVKIILLLIENIKANTIHSTADIIAGAVQSVFTPQRAPSSKLCQAIDTDMQFAIKERNYISLHTQSRYTRIREVGKLSFNRKQLSKKILDI